MIEKYSNYLQWLNWLDNYNFYLRWYQLTVNLTEKKLFDSSTDKNVTTYCAIDLKN